MDIFKGTEISELKLAFIATEKFCICAILEKSDNALTEICLVIDKLEFCVKIWTVFRNLWPNSHRVIVPVMCVCK